MTLTFVKTFEVNARIITKKIGQRKTHFNDFFSIMWPCKRKGEKNICKEKEVDRANLIVHRGLLVI